MAPPTFAVDPGLAAALLDAAAGLLGAAALAWAARRLLPGLRARALSPAGPHRPGARAPACARVDPAAARRPPPRGRAAGAPARGSRTRARGRGGRARLGAAAARVGRRRRARGRGRRGGRRAVSAIRLADARALRRFARRTVAVRAALAAVAVGLVVGFALLDRHPRSRTVQLLPTHASAIVALDLSASISADTFGGIGRTLADLARSGSRFGLVVFSDSAYEALRPGRRPRRSRRSCATSRCRSRPRQATPRPSRSTRGRRPSAPARASRQGSRSPTTSRSRSRAASRPSCCSATSTTAGQLRTSRPCQRRRSAQALIDAANPSATVAITTPAQPGPDLSGKVFFRAVISPRSPGGRYSRVCNWDSVTASVLGPTSASRAVTTTTR